MANPHPEAGETAPTTAGGSLQERVTAFMEHRTSATPVVRAIRMQMRQGCGDHGCEFNPPKGMGTNGGCRCWRVIDDVLYMAKAEARSTPGGAHRSE